MTFYKLQVTEQAHGATYYKPMDSRTPQFQPFDLEAFWGRRAVHNLHNRGHQ